MELSKIESCRRSKSGKPSQAYQPTWGQTGGDNRARTGDLLRAKQALSQLSYIPCLRNPNELGGPKRS